MHTVETTVRGAVRVNVRTFDTLAEAEAWAKRWRSSNSTGHYIASVDGGKWS